MTTTMKTALMTETNLSLNHHNATSSAITLKCVDDDDGDDDDIRSKHMRPDDQCADHSDQANEASQISIRDGSVQMVIIIKPLPRE